jgi:predicted DsbA family dithiol-disulfide isomerase
VSAAPVLIRHFTDPSSPDAFAAEPARLRLLWLYGEQLRWELRMIALTGTADATPEEVAEQHRAVQQRCGMPIDSRVRVRVAPSVHACRVVVAVRLRWPEREAAILRRLRVLHFAGELLDDSDTFELAAEQAGLPVAELAAWAAEPVVEEALRADVAASRGRGCPSYELVRDGGRVALSGVEGIARAEAGLHDLARRPDPESVEEVLAWAGMPLATAEVAAVCDREVADVRQDLARVAAFAPLGADGYWTRRNAG